MKFGGDGIAIRNFQTRETLVFLTLAEGACLRLRKKRHARISTRLTAHFNARSTTHISRKLGVLRVRKEYQANLWYMSHSYQICETFSN